MVTSTNINDLYGSTRIMYDALSRITSTHIICAERSLFSYKDSKGDDHLMFSTSSDKSSATGVIIAGNKSRSAAIIKSLSLPMPEDKMCNTITEAVEFMKRYKKVVVKPIANRGGKGVSTGITTLNELKRAFVFAKEYGQKVIVQQHLEGTDLRLLVVGGRFVSAVCRIPALVIGDGTHTIRELIAQENASERRNNPKNVSLLQIDKTAANRYLGQAVTSIPPEGKSVRVVGPANISLGGELKEATHLMNKGMISDAERITNELKLGLCGVDMIWNQKTGTYGIIEVNAIPGIDIHDDPFSGTSSDAANLYAKWLVA